MTNWEYMSLTGEAKGFFDRTVDQDAFVADLNQHGKLGWELVGVFEVSAGQGQTQRVYAVLKRPK
jgi:hypothetical protein